MRIPRRTAALAAFLGCALSIAWESPAWSRAEPPHLDATCTSTTIIPGNIGGSASAFLNGLDHAPTVEVQQCMAITTTYPVRLRLQFTETVDSKNMGVRVYIAPVSFPPHTGPVYDVAPPIVSCVPIGPRTSEVSFDLACNAQFRLSFYFYWSLPSGCIPGNNEGTVVASVERSPITGSGPIPQLVAGGQDESATLAAVSGVRIVREVEEPSGTPPMKPRAERSPFKIPADDPPGGPPPDFTDHLDAIRPYFFYENVGGVQMLRVNEAAAAAAGVPQIAIDIGNEVARINNVYAVADHTGVDPNPEDVQPGTALHGLFPARVNRATRYPCHSIDDPQPTPLYNCSNFYSQNYQDVVDELVSHGYHDTPLYAGAGFTKVYPLPGCGAWPMAGRLHALIKLQGACWTYWFQGPEPNPEISRYWNNMPQDSNGLSDYWPVYNSWWHLWYTDHKPVGIVPSPECPSFAEPQGIVAGLPSEISELSTATATLLASAFAVTAFPNPSVGRVALAGSGPALTGLVKVVICDVAGRRVFLQQGEARGGRFRVEWDGSDLGGTRVRPGLYFARVESSAGIAQRTVILTQ